MTDDHELDVRGVARPDRHPLVFAAYDELEVGRAIRLVNDHEPRHLREEFDRELAGGYEWESLGESDGAWRVRIVKTAQTPLPRIVVDTTIAPDPGAAGSVWQLSPPRRDLDANVIALPPGDEIATHRGPALDVLVHVLDGSGTLETEGGVIPLSPGALVWLPPHAQRRFVAGADGLRYLSVHRRKPPLTITAAP